MLHFDSDYMEGAHASILARLAEINRIAMPGYGTDAICRSAADKIRAACAAPNAAVSFLVGGTQTNATVVDALLRPYEGVLAADTGHVAVHEAGAIEFGGHKVLTLPQENGKLRAAAVRQYLEDFYADANHEHMVAPGMVYLSHPTEYGTLYTAAELTQLHETCQDYHIPLYLDGARLGYGLAAAGTDVTLPVIAACCDVFYIGGTKVGALFGEAVVIPDRARIAHFFTMVKQHGALLAKGWLLGVQFDALFTDALYTKLGAHAVTLAMRLKQGLLEKGYRLAIDSPTNQQFVVMENDRLRRLDGQVTYGVWEKADENHTVIRFATSWATEPHAVDALLALL
ncbi:MAG: beta-eliminating lyase-related protein [Oscillospiraceae bacterium]|nr:beta-eliminating lyase-related protein [Oscillospiraceae bacterium]